ncbi:peptidyl-prolyl cis-trans isomerase FKBP18, chloroplastic isoform X2 [Nymphaea colorata]|uniref:peptidyl-prolyl cis-trans isomerase FKBP18, chloroplastic isoform X2 n=1 Tax=Nymphaea colorata TaxID=210225 RepID=UPI00129EEFC6|nr:peptidyl-prolyl cis-trans isomerase FKBP18, chloroplastic isoform X2 [Nymphaea colorata]
MATLLPRVSRPPDPSVASFDSSVEISTNSKIPISEIPFPLIPNARRRSLLLSVLSLNLLVTPPPSLARERRLRRTIPIDEYSVHFDCIYRGITAVSSRESKLLAGNRIIAQPYEFTVGAPPGKERKREYVDSANGLFSAQAAPKPPAAMYSITEGMKVGGKRSVIVPPEAGYGKKGMNEIPPGETFELNVELLEVLASPTK